MSRAFQFQQEAGLISTQSNRARSQRRASLDTSAGFMNLSFLSSNQVPNSPIASSSSPSAPIYSTTQLHNQQSSSSSPPNLKRSNSQPNLHPFPLRDTISLPPSSSLHSPTPQQNSHEIMDQDDHHSLITRFPRRCSPLIVNRHKRTASVASSMSSAIAHQHQLLMLNRHQIDPDDEDDEIEIEGGMSGLLRAAAQAEENQIIDCTHDDRRASVSCGSSAVGEPMAIDSEPTIKPSPHVGSKKVRRKPANRANLLPRPRAHLRVAAQLSTEEVSPDVLTEAEVHRRFKSIPFVLPQPSSSTPTNTLPSTTPSNSPLIPRTPSSPFYHQPYRPTPNRFPEQVDDDVEDNRLDAESSSSDDAPTEDHQSHCSGLRHSAISQDEESEDQKIIEIQKWKMFRGSGNSGSCGPADINRGGKRRCQDLERHESGPFKRRAVSPSSTSLSSCIGSPILNPVSISHSALTTTTTTAPSSHPIPTHIPIHQPTTVNSSSSSSVSSIGFRGSLPAHHSIINSRNSLSTTEKDDFPMSTHSSSA